MTAKANKPSPAGEDAASALRAECAQRARAEAAEAKVAELERALALARSGTRARDGDALATAERVRDYFVSVLSHDMRGPIGTILTWAHLLRAGQLSKEKSAQALDAIERSARAQVRLLEQVVDLSRIRSRQLEVARQPLDLVVVLRCALDGVRAAIETKRIVLTQRVEGPLPIDGDEDRLRQALVHVLENSIRATPEEGQIEIETCAGAGSAEVSIRDSGNGLEPSAATSLLEHARSFKPPVQGRRGIGLPFAVSVVDLLGGSIELTSEGPGHGITVRVRLPLRSGAASSGA